MSTEQTPKGKRGEGRGETEQKPEAEVGGWRSEDNTLETHEAGSEGEAGGRVRSVGFGG